MDCEEADTTAFSLQCAFAWATPLLPPAISFALFFAISFRLFRAHAISRELNLRKASCKMYAIRAARNFKFDFELTIFSTFKRFWMFQEEFSKENRKKMIILFEKITLRLSFLFSSRAISLSLSLLSLCKIPLAFFCFVTSQFFALNFVNFYFWYAPSEVHSQFLLSEWDFQSSGSHFARKF